jgi:hypothetical protein
LLKHPIIQKRIDYFKSYQEDIEDQALLQTIKIPKNLLFLSDKLPQPNYEKHVKKNSSFTKKANNDLPDVRMNALVNKIQNKMIRKEAAEGSSRDVLANNKDPTTESSKKVPRDTEKASRSEDHKREATASKPKEPELIIKETKDRSLDSGSRRIKNMPIIYDIPVIKPSKRKPE